MLAGRDKAFIDERETEKLLKPLHVGRIQLYSTGLLESERKSSFVEIIPSLEEAAANRIRKYGDTEIAVVPEGPYVIPLYGGR